jgi:hypothetical protein
MRIAQLLSLASQALLVVAMKSPLAQYGLRLQVKIKRGHKNFYSMVTEKIFV